MRSLIRIFNHLKGRNEPPGIMFLGNGFWFGEFCGNDSSDPLMFALKQFENMTSLHIKERLNEIKRKTKELPIGV